MPSTFFGLNIAYSGLTAANAALNTTGNNIANRNTKGYSRQEVSQEAYEALRAFTTYGCIGAGVNTIAIERIRNEFYDTKYWNNQTVLGQYDKKQYYMEEIEDYFKDDEKLSPGFTTLFNKMYAALQDVADNSGSTESKKAFVGTAESIVGYFNTMSGNLQKVQEDANAEIKTQVDSINSIAQQIATLNQQINTIELTGTAANELRDKRTLLLDDLSKIINIQVTETPIIDANDTSRITGANRFVVCIGAGQTLVDMNDTNLLECVPRGLDEKINQSDAEGLYDIRWLDTKADFGMHNIAINGSLRGLIDIRDGNNTANFQGTASAVGTTVVGGDTLQTVSVQVTADYLKDLNKCTLPESGGIITVANTKYQYDSWEFDSTTNTYKFVLNKDNQNRISSASINKTAKVGESIDYKGVPYYMEQMNEWIRNYSATFNRIITQTGAVDGNGDPAGIFFTGVAQTGQYTLGATSTATGYDPQTDSQADSYYRLTALNFRVADEIVADANKMASHTGATDGQDKSDIIESLLDLKTNKDKMSFRGGSSEDFLQCILSDIALSASKANTGYLNYTNVSNTIENQRLEVSGVDEDEEAVNLVKYQNAYTLASKMISVLTECYDRLILSTGV